jgi:hypothetical protein
MTSGTVDRNIRRVFEHSSLTSTVFWYTVPWSLCKENNWDMILYSQVEDEVLPGYMTSDP